MFSPRKRRKTYLRGWRNARRMLAAASEAAAEEDRETDHEDSENNFGSETADDEALTSAPEDEGHHEINFEGATTAIPDLHAPVDLSESDADGQASDDSFEMHVLYSSEDENEEREWSDDETKTASIVLRGWALRNNISHNALDDLLREIRTVEPLDSWNDLPLSARTLLKTTGRVPTEFIGPMERVNLDIKETIVSNFLKYPATLRNATVSIPILLSTDGMPLYNSANKNLWPLMCAIQLEPMFVFPLALSLGPPKPPSAAFLTDTLASFNHVLQDGIEVDGRIVPLDLRCVIADAPARAMIKGTVQFNSTSGCDKCSTRSVWTYSRDSDNEAAAVERVLINEAERRGQATRHIRRKKKRGGRSTFQETDDLQKRTDASFRMQTDAQHHKVPSPFLMLPMDMVDQFPIDYMHQVCLGVMKKLLHKWFQEAIRQRTLSAADRERADGRLVSLRSHMPREFARKPRTLGELKHWKATEFRQFLLYTGRYTMQDILPGGHYDNFLALSVACLILVSPTLTRDYVNLARELLQYFVQTVRTLYGAKWLHYNIHSMLHLADEAERYGSLDACSAFPFENQLYQMKKMVRAGKEPLQQLHHRLAELEVGASVLQKPLKRLISTKEPNNSYVLEDRTCVCVHLLDVDDALCHSYGVGRPAFMRPISSKRLGILLATDEPIEMIRVEKAKLTRKAMRLPTQDGKLFQVMQHDLAH